MLTIEPVMHTKDVNAITRGSAPVMIGLCLGRFNGGPYKTIKQFQAVLGGEIVSISDPGIARVGEDGVEHFIAKPGLVGKAFLSLSGYDEARLRMRIAKASHVQCHILFRHHAHVIWEEAQKTGTPYWVVPHGCLDPYVFTYRGLVKRTWMLAFGRRFLDDAAFIIFASTREKAKASCWLTRDNARVILWPVAIPSLARNEQDRAALRARLGLHGHPRILLWLGRLHEMKRPIECAKIFSSCMGPTSHVVFVGNDEAGLGSELGEIIQKAPHKNVHWLGPVYGEEKDKIVRGCDGYWSYSARENFNHAAAESMAAGLPVILSPGNDLNDELGGVPVGWLLTSDSTAAINGALQQWATMSDVELTALGCRARSWASDNLSYEKFEADLRVLESETVAAQMEPKPKPLSLRLGSAVVRLFTRLPI